jgi:hypothetical protein
MSRESWKMATWKTKKEILLFYCLFILILGRFFFFFAKVAKYMFFRNMFQSQKSQNLVHPFTQHYLVINLKSLA